MPVLIENKHSRKPDFRMPYDIPPSDHLESTPLSPASEQHERTQQDQTQRELKSYGRSLPITTIVLGVLLLAVLVPYIARRVTYELNVGRERARATVARENIEDLNLRDVSYRFRQLVTLVRPSVVHINTIVEGSAARADGLSFYLQPNSPTRQGQGSGVIVDSEGYIVTNHHVIRDADQITVTLSDGRVLDGQLVGKDESTDLAVIKISAANLEALEWEPDDSSAFEPGSLVWALGSPFGLDHSVTMGIISARERRAVLDDGQINPYQGFLQHDAAVNPGNSGGPLVGPSGKLVGINTLIVSKTGGWQGVSFAIPSDIARDVYERLRSEGHYTRGHVGVRLAPVTEPLREQLQLTSNAGAVVRDVIANSPAHRAGVQIGDVFVEWNGEPVSDVLMFSRMVGRTRPGSKVEAVVMRDAKPLKLTLTIGERPANL